MQQHRNYTREDHAGAEHSARLREISAGADNVLRLALARKDEPAGPEDVVRQAGRAAIELLNQAADTVRANEARAESLLRRAIDQLAAAEARLGELEARTMQAEARAAEAEAWVRRVHQVVLDRFDGADAHLPSAPSFAA